MECSHIVLFHSAKNFSLSSPGLLKQIEEMKILHKEEAEKLHKKLKWYSENQQLLDRDMVVLKDKRDEVKELRELVDRLENENQRLRKDKAANQSEKNSDSTTILDLKRQVSNICLQPISSSVSVSCAYKVQISFR